ncbi:hypothetical protein [Neisseria sp. HMSC31F04]|uniref:hypothetical protein n=1 Tax=Neisseria sp. HMSC31F04 TaxID=1581075 RepID=UPI00143C2FD3|nr:hypothetical protein [Neisseria sp. HMSC31F04]
MSRPPCFMPHTANGRHTPSTPKRENTVQSLLSNEAFRRPYGRLPPTGKNPS